MKDCRRHTRVTVIRDESGFLLIITMVILVVLTVVGMAALDSSIFEIKIASNDRQSKVSFNLADGSVYSTSKLINEAVKDGVDPGYSTVLFQSFTSYEGNVAVTNNANDFYKRVMGFLPVQGNPDFQIRPKGTSEPEAVEVRIVTRNAAMIAGGGVEFGAGAAGAGVGSGGGGAAVTYDINIDGYAGNNTRSSLAARYRSVLGSSGGL